MDNVRKLVAIVLLMVEIVILAALSLLPFPLSPHRYVRRILIRTLPIEIRFQIKMKNTFPTVKSWTKVEGAEFSFFPKKGKNEEDCWDCISPASPRIGLLCE